MDALQVLQESRPGLRRKVDTASAQIVLLKDEVASSPRGAGQDLRWMRSTAEQREAKNALLAQPMDGWSEAHVQEWVALIGLPSEQVEIVQRALAKENFEGGDLEEMGKRQLQKMLQKAGADDAPNLAEQTLELHEAARDEAGPEGKLAAAEEQLFQARQALRQNNAAKREQIVDLVSLAQYHFPELLHSHEDVKTFMDSDGLQIKDRRLTDYDKRRPIAVGRSKLLLCSMLDGVQVILKEFPLHNDMRGYMKEIVNVQRLKHRNIIRYSAVFEDEGSMYIEMEHCKHGSLIQWVQEAQPDPVQKQSVLRQVLLALACMHDQKIVHCDIKGDNVLIAGDGTARICDFEMSKDLGATSASTMAGGTLGFIAPEVKDKKQKASPASDMYSYGVLALNLLHPPAPADYPLTDPSVLTDPALQTWVAQLMRDNPDQRPTALQLQAEPYFAVECAGREHWGSPTVSADGLGLECLSAELCRQLDGCLQPGDASQLGKGADASSWGTIPDGERRIQVQKAWRVQRETLWQQYRDKLDVVAEQMQRVPAEHQKPISPAKPKPLRDPPAHWDAMAFARATQDLPGHGQLRTDVNEMYLLTGVPSETVHKVLMSGFDERFR
jgi:serine/threonine protein kinase